MVILLTTAFSPASLYSYTATAVGLAQGYWYFEGPIDNDGLAILALYTNDLRFGEYPITGSLTLNYNLDFTTATVNSVACSPSYLCDRWPTQLTGGVDANLSESDEVVNCLYNRTAPLAGLNAVVSEFSSTTGTTYFCSNPTVYQPSAVNGSWIYINNAGKYSLPLSLSSLLPCLV